VLYVAVCKESAVAAQVYSKAGPALLSGFINGIASSEHEASSVNPNAAIKTL
jgi:hypothetical protein